MCEKYKHDVKELAKLYDEWNADENASEAQKASRLYGAVMLLSRIYWRDYWHICEDVERYSTFENR